MKLIIAVPSSLAQHTTAIRRAVLAQIVQSNVSKNLGNQYLSGWAREAMRDDRGVEVTVSSGRNFSFQPVHTSGPARWGDKHKGRKAVMKAVREAIGDRNYPTGRFVFKTPCNEYAQSTSA